MWSKSETEDGSIAFYCTKILDTIESIIKGANSLSNKIKIEENCILIIKVNLTIKEDVFRNTQIIQHSIW